MAKHTELANAIQRELNIEDEQTMALMAQASLLGVTDDKLDDVTKTAIGLSEAMGISLDDGLKKARLALEGNFIGIDKLVPSIKELSTNEEKLAATLALAEKGLTVKKEAALAASQADERMGLAFGEFMESVGAAILPLQELVYNGLEIVITTLNTAFGPAIANAGGFFESFTENVVAGAQWLAESIIGAVTFIEVAWNNVGTVFELAGSVILLTIETLRADIEQALTVVIPAYATWFADNFFNIMRDVSMAVVSVFSNLGAIIGEIFGQIWLVITGQQTLSGAMEEVGRAAGRGLLYGFEATTAPLPEIASRAMTDTEKILNESMEQSATTIMDEFQTKFDERIGLLRSDLKDSPLTAKIELTSDKTKLDKLAQNKDSKAAKESRVKTDDTVLAASESRLLSRGKVDNAAGAETAANTATLVQQNSELREQMRVMNLSLSRISSNTEEMDVEEVS